MFRSILACVAFVLVIPTLQGQGAKGVFGLDKLHEFHIELSAKEWERMQKVSGGPTLFPPKKPIAKEGEEPFEWHKSPGFGLEFPWAHADLTADKKTYKNIGIRYKGNGSYAASASALKRNLKIEIDHYEVDQRFHGLRTITLNAGGVDASRLREALAYSIFRAAGMPTPRTAFAKVTLTVPGKYDTEYLGVYTFVEHVDKAFLQRHFQDSRGLLLKPERTRGIDYLGDDWTRYKARYFPKRDATPLEAERLIAFAKLVNKANDETFNKGIGSYLDIDNFLRFIAVTTMLPNTDSFLTTGHNFYIYLSPKTNKVAFMPWDLDIAFAGFPLMGSVDQQVNMNLLHPAQGKLKIVDRLLAIPEVNEQYRKILRELAGGAFEKKKLLADVDAMTQLLREPLALELKAKEVRKETVDKFGAWVSGFIEPQPHVRNFVERRTASVAKQLEAMKKSDLK
ncbi:MAG: hypothetical protein EXR98_14015 [Gemmataceae bacterium]|nr:hypothetical protein [Gemmataceae bacterium]